MDAILEAIAISSPSGHISKRSLRAAQERIRRELFGDGLKWQLPPQPDEATRLRHQAAMLRDLAERGMKVRAYTKKAAELEAQADALDVAYNHTRGAC